MIRNVHMASDGRAILVTGGVGYIGSHAVISLVAAGFRVVVLDSLVCGQADLVEGLQGGLRSTAISPKS